MHRVADEAIPVQPSALMLTGNQIAAARRLSGIGTQKELSRLSGVSAPTIERAERAKEEVPTIAIRQMQKLVQAFEEAGVEFFLVPGSSLNGGIGMRAKPAFKTERREA